MKAKTLSLSFALILCFLAAGAPPLAEAACPSNFCATQQQSCQGDCPIFTCDPVACWSDCSYPIFCRD